MAVNLSTVKLADGPKGTILKIVYEGDGTAVTNNVLVDSANLSGALDTTGNIRIGMTNAKTSYRTSIRKIYGHGSFGSGSHVTLKDANGVPGSNTIAAFGAGSIDLDFDFHSGGRIDVNGDILISTVGATNGDCMTLIVELRKHPEDFTRGQHADPAAFNVRGVV